MFGARGGAMSEDRSEEDSQLMDLWISNYEQQYVDAIEAEPDYENQLHNEKELYCQQIWSNFQTTATAIAQLYKDRSQGTSFWSPFQTAAGTVTSLYKESTNNIRRCSELGIEAGRQKRSRELMNWAKKKRRNIRREELLAYLAGKPPPPRHSHRSSPRPRMMICGSPPSQGPAASMVVSSTPPPGSEPDPELHTFREALSGSPMSRRTGRQAELSAFISSEFARHVKRPASHDVDMGSPTHKRSRLM